MSKRRKPTSYPSDKKPNEKLSKIENFIETNIQGEISLSYHELLYIINNAEYYSHLPSWVVYRQGGGTDSFRKFYTRKWYISNSGVDSRFEEYWHKLQKGED